VSVAVAPPASARVAMNPVAWVARDELELSEWVGYGRRIGVTGRSAGWWIGDWLRYGNARFGERYVRAARTTGYDVQTLTNMVYVASRFAIARRRESLSWSHHAELAALDPEQQEHWLAFAAAEHLSVRDLRTELRNSRVLRPAEKAEDERKQGRERRCVGKRERAGEIDAAPAATTLVCPECGHVIRTAGP
jgi:hypothetical protein